MDFVHNPYRCGPLRVGRYGVTCHGLNILPGHKHLHDADQKYCKGKGSHFRPPPQGNLSTSGGLLGGGGETS